MFNINASLKRFLCRNAPARKIRAERLCIVTATIFLGSIAAAHAAIPASERAVLENLYISTNGPHWASQEGWNGPSGTECSWFGVSCNSAGSTVTGIDLSDNGLYGVLPPLFGLTNLESLVVGKAPPANESNASAAPVNPIGGKPNDLYGPIPALNGLSKLKTFTAMFASFSGGIPSLAGMSNLQHFECVACGLSGSIGSLSGAYQLQYFNVSGDGGLDNSLPGLSGSIPSLISLRQLQVFIVDGNFTGELPDFGGLTKLQYVDIKGYRFDGGVPALFSLPDLQYFSVHGLVTGKIGGLSNLPSLQALSLADNLLAGTIPPLANLPNLQDVDVSNNEFTGSIPDLIGLDALQTFDVSYNQLSGSIPVPPQSLIDSAGGPYPSSVCPNMLTLAANPLSATDVDWNAITDVTPWSQDCNPNPLWKTCIDVSSNLNPSVVGQPVTFVAAVRGMNPTGTVTFTAGYNPPGIATKVLCDSVSLVGVVATCTVSDLPPTANNVYASYSGDANNAAAKTTFVDGNLIQAVNDFPLTETSSANPAQIGQPVDLTLTYGAGQEGDTVTFLDGDTAQCSNVPVHQSRSGHFIAHCVTMFAETGPHLLVAERNGSAVFGSVPIIQNVVAAKTFNANQFGLTGPWYNPATSGQGLQFAVYPGHQGWGIARLVGGWFTYDDSGHQRWMALQGDLSVSHGSTFDLLVGQGSGGNFNAAPVTPATAIGSAKLTFYDCGHAALTYSLDNGRSGTIPYTRLDHPPYECSGDGSLPDPPPPNQNDVQHSGAWYNPATSGQGVFLDLVPSQTSFFATWYTYAPQGNTADAGVARQRWFTLQDNTYTPGDLNLHDVKIIASSGGVFNQPSAIDIQQVGSADITFNSCTSMTLKYTFDKGEFSGQSGTINEQVLAPNPRCL